MVTFHGEGENNYDLGDIWVTQWSGEFAVAFHVEAGDRIYYHGIAYQGDDLSKALQTLAEGLGWYNVWQ